MSAIRPTAPRLAGSARTTTTVAALAQIVALAVVLADGSLAWAAVAVAAVGIGAAAWVLGPLSLAAVRRHPELLVVPALLGLVVVWAVSGLARVSAVGSLDRLLRIGTNLGAPLPARGDGLGGWPWRLAGVPVLPAALALLAAAGGLVLIADAVRVRIGLAPRQRAPWRQITATPADTRGIATRAVTGVVLTGVAVFLAIGIADSYAGRDPVLQLLVLVAGAGAGALIVIVPVAIGSQLRLDRDKAESARERERQRFAAHLHDSVLQTLALVQRQAHDPAAVARLARRQEHALRAWMAGETALLSETLVAALRDVVAEVEEEFEITVELTALGDRPLDAAGEALAAAAREALRNAARHAPGAKAVVFVEIAERAAEVFVRDDGPGFDAAAVAPERRGIRDAIVGRMASAGGEARVESAPGEGTEVALWIGAAAASR